MSKTYFISYTNNDIAWAEWVAWIVEDLGFRVTFQAWDFVPGKNWVHEMHSATKDTDSTICILTDDYLKSGFTAAEWQAAFADDPVGKKQKILPIKVKPCKPAGLLKTIVCINLVGMDKDAARDVIKNTLIKKRTKPKYKPTFPLDHGNEPVFPKTRKTYALVLDGEYDESVKRKIDTMLKHLKKILNDPSITITETTEGSIILHIESNYEIFKLLQRDFFAHKELKLYNENVLGIWQIEGGTAHPVEGRLDYYREKLVFFFQSEGENNEVARNLALVIHTKLADAPNKYQYLSSTVLTINLARITHIKYLLESSENAKSKENLAHPNGDIDSCAAYLKIMNILEKLSAEDQYILERYWESVFEEGKFVYTQTHNSAQQTDLAVKREIFDSFNVDPVSFVKKKEETKSGTYSRPNALSDLSQMQANGHSVDIQNYSNHRPVPESKSRRIQANRRREAARVKAESYPNPLTQFNGDESALETDGYAMSFTKGLYHSENGVLAEQAHYSSLTEAINQEAPTDFTQLVRGISEDPTRRAKTVYSGDAVDMKGKAPRWRGWESPRAGHYYSLEGPDADAVGMPPAPALGSIELDAEMAEVYALGLLRDVPFSDITSDTAAVTPSDIAVTDVITAMTSIEWYTNKTDAGLTLQERRRRAARFASHAEHEVDNPPNNGEFVRKDVFRGSAPGVKAGPYISQFMVQGTQLQNENSDGPDVYSNASIRYGSQEIDQKVSFFPEAVDYMLHWNAYLDVQNGADFSAANNRSHLPRRFINTPRDLATYVKFDQLYQAYLNACLYMLGSKGFEFQKPVIKDGYAGPGFPDRSPRDSRQGFATFGGPHILSLVTEVATRCLKAVRRQKYNYHRRARPERLGALLTMAAGAFAEADSQAKLTPATRDTLNSIRDRLAPLLALVNKHNQSRRTDTAIREDRPPRKDGADVTERSHADPHLQNDSQQLDPAGWDDDKNYLLPMAFAEGSPMHPSYGAGHATVAGGCVTMLKAFFHTVEDDGTAVEWPENLPVVEVENGGQELRNIRTTIPNDNAVTIEGELNKLAANISIGRNMAGVHFYTDYYESLRMGERVSTGILLEHLMQVDEPIEMSFHSFDGDFVHLVKNGGGSEVDIVITDSQGRSMTLEQWWTRHLPPTLIPKQTRARNQSSRSMSA